MASIRRVAVVACIALLVAFATSIASADTVRCEPLVREGKLVGYCVTVCNGLEDPCTEAGCIYDLHLTIVSKCKFRQIKGIPAGWTGTITGDAVQANFVTPPPTGGEPNPIRPGQCRRFCFTVDCTVNQCFEIEWATTDKQGQILDSGATRCCPPAPAG